MNTTAMLRKLGKGLFVTGLSGEGVRLINGDYSRVARGFWVEGGRIVHPVHEVTIAGHLRDMFKGIAAIGADTYNDVRLPGGFQVAGQALLGHGLAHGPRQARALAGLTLRPPGVIARVQLQRAGSPPG